MPLRQHQNRICSLVNNQPEEVSVPVVSSIPTRSIVLTLILLCFPAHTSASIGDIACTIDQLLAGVGEATTRRDKVTGSRSLNLNTEQAEILRAET